MFREASCMGEAEAFHGAGDGRGAEKAQAADVFVSQVDQAGQKHLGDGEEAAAQRGVELLRCLAGRRARSSTGAWDMDNMSSKYRIPRRRSRFFNPDTK